MTPRRYTQLTNRYIATMQMQLEDKERFRPGRAPYSTSRQERYMLLRDKIEEVRDGRG